MNLLGWMSKPQYVLRPAQLLRRFINDLRPDASRSPLVMLPWGSELEVDAQDTVGHALLRQGLYDIVTSEVLWRLTTPGDTAFDVGANVGYFASLMGRQAGLRGHVIAFEPHPYTFSILQRNVLRSSSTSSRITAVQIALSNNERGSYLDLTREDGLNKSHSFLNNSPSQNGIAVPTARAERYIGPASSIGILKIDAQGHEAAILEGFGEHLRLGTIRDIVYEEEGELTARSHLILQEAGYSIFWFKEHFLRLKIANPRLRAIGKRPYDIAPSYLATLDPVRAKNKLSTVGWKFFNGF
jgi:FkbM family methyltransferase